MTIAVIPGRDEVASPESIVPVVVMDSGPAAARRPERRMEKWENNETPSINVDYSTRSRTTSG